MLSPSLKQADEWYQKNRHALKPYRGEWVAFTADGVIAHDKDYFAMLAQIDPAITEFIIDRVHEYDFVDPIRLYGVRFRNLKKHEWVPKRPVQLKSQSTRSVEMLVDSGADVSLISYQLGIDLGFTRSPAEIVESALSVGGQVEFLMRQVEMVLEGNTFNAPVAWLQSDLATDNLLGREKVFDLFDIEFKQADEQIIFKFR
jgi:hypothetical protein